MRSGACADSLSLVLAPYTSRYRPAHPSNCLSGGDWGVSRLYSLNLFGNPTLAPTEAPDLVSSGAAHLFYQKQF